MLHKSGRNSFVIKKWSCPAEGKIVKSRDTDSFNFLQSCEIEKELIKKLLITRLESSCEVANEVIDQLYKVSRC